MSNAAAMVPWLDERLGELLTRPRMWGSREAVEMQVLQLLEAKAVAINAHQAIETPQRIFDLYVSFLRERFPSGPNRPLFLHLDDKHDDAEFAGVLKDFCRGVELHLHAPNPFASADIVLKMFFKENASPNAAAVTGFYETFRKTTKALSRPGGSQRGTTRPLDVAADFVLADDLRIARPSPTSAQAHIALDMRRDADEKSVARVRASLAQLVTLVDWANAAGAKIDDLPIDDDDQWRHLALQALRVVPHGDVSRVELGGVLIARPRPVSLQQSHAARFTQVLFHAAKTEPFDETGEVRALDLDRESIKLQYAAKLPRIECFALSGLFGSITHIGAGDRVRVQGQLYRPNGKKSFVVARDISTVGSADGFGGGAGDGSGDGRGVGSGTDDGDGSGDGSASSMSPS